MTVVIFVFLSKIIFNFKELSILRSLEIQIQF